MIEIDEETREKLWRAIRAPSTPQSLVMRSKIVLAAAEGWSNQEIAAEMGIPEVTVGKWRRAFAALGIEGLKDRVRSGRPRVAKAPGRPPAKK